MKTEISAGGVILRREQNGWEVLLLQDMNSSWTFPKGLIEKGEEPEAAAQREIAEEVGLTDATLIAPLPEVKYSYRRNGIIHKTVYYFLFTSRGKEALVPQKEEGIHNAQWVPLTKAMSIVGYRKTNVALLDKAKQVIKGYGNTKSS